MSATNRIANVNDKIEPVFETEHGSLYEADCLRVAQTLKRKWNTSPSLTG